MAATILRKQDLFRIIERAILDSGWQFLHLAAGLEHPGRYEVYRGDSKIRTRIYVWNLTHGGGSARAADEYRIQITSIPGPSGAQEFVPEIGAKTIILGWWDTIEVFAGFDYRRHTGPLGQSPSIQIRESALNAASKNGFAPSNKGNGELAIAFRPDFIGTYIQNLEELHDSGNTTKEIELLEDLGEDPDEVDDEEIDAEIPNERKFAIVTTRKALRDINFRDRVLTAYGHRCAMCSVQLKLLDAAHILPAAHPDSTDQTSNGVSLCALHHRAFDRALVTFDDAYKVLINEHQVGDFEATGHEGGLQEFRSALRPVLIVPPDKKDKPDPKFIAASNTVRGWTL